MDQQDEPIDKELGTPPKIGNYAHSRRAKIRKEEEETQSNWSIGVRSNENGQIAFTPIESFHQLSHTRVRMSCFTNSNVSCLEIDTLYDDSLLLSQ